MAERRGTFTRHDLSRVQQAGLAILYDRDHFREMLEKQTATMDSLKFALIAHDPTRMPTLYPAFASAPTNTTETIQAMDSGAPMEIRTVVPTDEAEEFFRMVEDGELTITELDGVFAPDGTDF